MMPPDNMVVDHINHDTLDNRRSNLRICTHKQNLANRKKHKLATSKYKGVRRINRKTPWEAEISGKYIGVFKTEKEAALAYNTKAKELFDQYAYLNALE